MSTPKTHHHMIYIMICAGLILVVLALYITWKPSITAQILAQGGQVTQVDITINNPTTHWLGVYGTLLSSGVNGSVNVSNGQVLQVNLSYASPGPSTRIMASLGSINWDTLTVASHEDINTLIGAVPSDQASASNTFTEKTNFTLGGVIYETWSTHTLAQSGVYITGAFKSDDNLAFITRYVSGGIGFSGEATDFQLLLPLNTSGLSNYSIVVFENDSLPLQGSFSCNQSFNLSAIVAGDKYSVILDWNELLGADSYEVLYLDGPTYGNLNFSNATSVNVGSASSWIDSDNSSLRMYTIRANSGSQSCTSPQQAGTLSMELSPDYNLISIPYISENMSVREVLSTIDGAYTSLFEYDNNNRAYNSYLIVGASIFKNFNTMKTGKGYWIYVSDNTVLRLAGLQKNEVIENLTTPYSLISFPIITNTNHNDTIKHVLSSIDGSYGSLFEFDNIQKSYYSYLIVGASIFKTYNSFTPGRADWIYVNENVTVNYAND